MKKICLSIIFICLLFLCSCNTHEAAASSYAKAYLGLEVFLADAEAVQVEYQEVWYYEPWVKVYYIEEEKWGLYSLEQNAELVEKLALSQLILTEDEHIVYIKTYDYQVCDYVEEYICSIVNNEVNIYCIVVDREGNFWGSMKKENIKYGLEILKNKIDEPTEGAFYFDAMTYMARYMIHDVNEDGYPDIYDRGNELYLWDNNEYRACSESERRTWLDASLRTNADIKEIEERNIYGTTYSNMIEDDDGAIMYL